MSMRVLIIVTIQSANNQHKCYEFIQMIVWILNGIKINLIPNTYSIYYLALTHQFSNTSMQNLSNLTRFITIYVM